MADDDDVIAIDIVPKLDEAATERETEKLGDKLAAGAKGIAEKVGDAFHSEFTERVEQGIENVGGKLHGLVGGLGKTFDASDILGGFSGLQDKFKSVDDLAKQVGVDISDWGPKADDAKSSLNDFSAGAKGVLDKAKEFSSIFDKIPGKIGAAALKMGGLAAEVGLVVAGLEEAQPYIEKLDQKIHDSSGPGKWFEEHSPSTWPQWLADHLGAKQSREFFGRLFGYDPTLGHGGDVGGDDNLPPGITRAPGGGFIASGPDEPYPQNFIGPLPLGAVRAPGGVAPDFGPPKGVPNFYKDWYGPGTSTPEAPDKPPRQSGARGLGQNYARGPSGGGAVRKFGPSGYSGDPVYVKVAGAESGMPGAPGGGAAGIQWPWLNLGFQPPVRQLLSMASGTNWDAIAQGESGGNWRANTGNGYYGGLQFAPNTWNEYGGAAFAPRADLATPDQQKTIAEAVLRGQGPGAWPNTFHLGAAGMSGGSDFGASAGHPTIGPPDENTVRSWVQQNFGIPNTFGTGSWENAAHGYDGGWHHPGGAKQGYAFDFHGSPQQMSMLANWVAENDAKNTLELIYGGPGFDRSREIKNAKFGDVYGAGLNAEHTDHVHWAMTAPPYMGGASGFTVSPAGFGNAPAFPPGLGAVPPPPTQGNTYNPVSQPGLGHGSGVGVGGGAIGLAEQAGAMAAGAFSFGGGAIAAQIAEQEINLAAQKGGQAAAVAAKAPFETFGLHGGQMGAPSTGSGGWISQILGGMIGQQFNAANIAGATQAPKGHDIHQQQDDPGSGNGGKSQGGIGGSGQGTTKDNPLHVSVTNPPSGAPQGAATSWGNMTGVASALTA